VTFSEIAKLPTRTKFREVGCDDEVLIFSPYDKGYGPDGPPILKRLKLGGRWSSFLELTQEFFAGEFEVLTPEQLESLNERDKQIREAKMAGVES
jgi:hypothetical protein